MNILTIMSDSATKSVNKLTKAATKIGYKFGSIALILLAFGLLLFCIGFTIKKIMEYFQNDKTLNVATFQYILCGIFITIIITVFSLWGAYGTNFILEMIK